MASAPKEEPTDAAKSSEAEALEISADQAHLDLVTQLQQQVCSEQQAFCNEGILLQRRDSIRDTQQ